MIRFHPSMLLTGLLLFSIAGCKDRPITGLGPPQKPSEVAAVTVPTGPRTIDDEFAALAQEIPGFGGFIFDANGNMVVHLTDTMQAVVARHVLAPHLNRWRGPRGQALTQRRVIIKQGQFDFAQMRNWRALLRPTILGLTGVVGLDIDEGQNRIRIGVEDLALHGRIMPVLAKLKIPRRAVVLEKRNRVMPTATIREMVRPIPGGVQIQWSTWCTLGFNAVLGSDRGFVTASHCSGRTGGVQNTAYYQPNSAFPAVAVELVDPEYSTGFNCPAGKRCRWSDAAFARYNSTASYVMGRIARTTSYGNASPGSITIDPANPQFFITGEKEYPLQGDLVDKMGQAAGWTYGSVTHTCVDTGVGTTDVFLWCQDFTSAYTAGGDSGGPQFYWDGGSGATLAGITWGGDASHSAFSNMSNVEWDLGTLTTQ